MFLQALRPAAVILSISCLNNNIACKFNVSMALSKEFSLLSFETIGKNPSIKLFTKSVVQSVTIIAKLRSLFRKTINYIMTNRAHNRLSIL